MKKYLDKIKDKFKKSPPSKDVPDDAEVPSSPASNFKEKLGQFATKIKEQSKELYQSKIKNADKKPFNIETLVQGLFSESAKAGVHKAFIWTLSLSSAVMMGQMIGSALTVQPTANKAPKQLTSHSPNLSLNKDLAALDQNDLFKAAKHESSQQAPEPQKKPVLADINLKCDEADKRSTLPLKLEHTVVLQDSVKSIAAVQIRGKKDALTVREGDQVEGMAKIEKIQRLRVVFKNLDNGQCEYIQSKDPNKGRKKSKIANYQILSPKKGKKLLQKDAAGIKSEGNTFTIKKSERDKLLANIDELLTQALAIQIKNADGTLSFKMTEIVPGSFYSKIDIQNGDIINSINGKPITNLNQIMNTFSKISEIDQFELGVQRNGSHVTKEYNFE
ncbi:MAG: type II secretion system protein N [Bacteriovoracaceae bacterium]